MKWSWTGAWVGTFITLLMQASEISNALVTLILLSVGSGMVLWDKLIYRAVAKEILQHEIEAQREERMRWLVLAREPTTLEPWEWYITARMVAEFGWDMERWDSPEGVRYREKIRPDVKKHLRQEL